MKEPYPLPTRLSEDFSDAVCKKKTVSLDSDADSNMSRWLCP